MLVFGSLVQADQPVVLAVGRNHQIQVPSGSTIRVSNSKVVRVQDLGTALLLSGRKPGQAVISHARGAVRVEVVSSSVAQTYLQFQSALKRMQGLHLDVQNNQALITGELLRLVDWKTLIELQKVSGGAWRFQASIPPDLSSRVRRFLMGLLASRIGSTHRLNLEPYPHITTSAKAFAYLNEDRQLQNHGLGVLRDANLGDLQPAIRLKLTLAEVQNGASQRLGLKFQDGQSLQLLPRFKAPGEFIAALNFLADKGLARLLATPSLTARSGHEAEFLAGGEFAVRTSSYRVKEVSWKRHGLYLKFKPQLDPRGLVQLEISTEFSAPDYSNQIDGIPSLRTSKAASAIDVKLGSTVMLSGLIRASEGFASSGPMILSEIPILGRLFRSEDFNSQRSELLIFVTPELIPLETDEDVQLPTTEAKWNSID